jgi:hypothetical protein
MNWTQNWSKQRPHIQRQWQELTNEDLDSINGDRETLRQKLQDRYGYTAVEVDEELDAFENPAEGENMEFEDRVDVSGRSSRDSNDKPRKGNRDGKEHGGGMDQGQTNHRR